MCWQPGVLLQLANRQEASVMAAQHKPRYTLEEYLELDRISEERLEYWDGELFAMSGASENHLEIEANLVVLFRAALAGRTCRVFTANARIKVPTAPPYRYADLSALCGKAEFVEISGVDALTNPTLLIEVLSPSTEAYDRGDKFSGYQSIPSFREYWLVAQHRPHVTQLVRQDDGSWLHREFNSLEEVMKSASLDCELALQDIYQGVTFPAETAEPPPETTPRS
jgi:Uma2 family endonuclease